MNNNIGSSDRPCALVTGATSGIGAAFADRLARDGFDLILHGRRREILLRHADDLERTSGVAVETIIAELSLADEVKKVEERIRGLARLDMLVNNAGYWEPGLFWEGTPDSLQAMIMVHNVAPVRFICAALPRMLDRDRGDIINVSSIGAYLNMVTLENYGATKAYLVSFTESLHVALMKTGIRVQVLIPGNTATEFHSRLGANFAKDQKGWARPEIVVNRSLNALEKNRVVCIPGFRQRLIVWLVGVMPRPVYYRLMKVMGGKLKETWDRIENARAG